MNRSDLNFEFPENLVATAKVYPSRVMIVEKGRPTEISLAELVARIPRGDLLVINDTKVIKRRVFAQDRAGREFEVLFLSEIEPQQWKVLFPASRLKERKLFFPGGVETSEIGGGKPQTLRLSAPLNPDYFEKHGELPLPPYIQKARGERHNIVQDTQWYQTAWAEKPGSTASPTASLHFTADDLSKLCERGVNLKTLTLHVGMGTFLPVETEDLNRHIMHEEEVAIPRQTWEAVQETKARGGKIWALGTTVTRALESAARGLLTQDPGGNWSGVTGIFIKPPFESKVVDVLMTNFHQPESTLLALVAAFAGLENVKKNYQWAIERNFRLFSYGDLTVWLSP